MNAVNQASADVEKALISKASRGSLDAFNQLVQLYQSLAYQYAYFLIGDVASAEDVTQESFIKAFKGIHRFRGDTLRSWLLKIVTNTAYDLLRQYKRHSTRSFFLIDENGQEFYPYDLLADPSPSVEATVEQNEYSKRLYRMLDELPELYRSVLTLVDIYALGYAEVSEILEVPIGTVKSRLARARMLMRKKILGDPEYFIYLNQAVTIAAPKIGDSHAQMRSFVAEKEITI